MITLDIEDTTIKMVHIEGKRVVKAASLPLEAGLVKDGIILNKVAVSQRITEFLAAYDIDDKKVAANISGMHSLYRILRLPRLPKNMVDEAVRRQIPKVLPVLPAQVYTSWQAVDISSTETVVCLVGSPRDTVDALWETLRLAGLQPQFLEINPVALARLLNEKNAIGVYIQHVGFDIVLMFDGVPRLVRSLSFSSEDLLISDRVNAVKEEIERTLAFYKSSQAGDFEFNDLSVFLCGESQEMLSHELGYSVKQLPSWFIAPEGFDVREYPVNIGLALRVERSIKSPSKVSLNAIPEAHLPKPRPKIEVISWIFMVVAFAIIVPLLILTSRQITQTAILQNKVNAAQNQVNTIKATTAEINDLEAQLEKAQKSLGNFQMPIDTFEARQVKLNKDLATVTGRQPGRLTLKSISYNRGNASIVISGTAPDKALIMTYVTALRDSGRFSYVVVQTMQEVEFNKWDFTLELR